MGRYVIKRLLFTVVVLFGVAVIIFTILSLTPGSPVRSILGLNATPERIAELEHRLGLDKPLPQRFFEYILGLLHGDFGTSYITNQPVGPEIINRFKPTLLLAIFSIILSSVVGILVGVLSAVRQYSLLDDVSTITALVISAVPAFWLGMMLVFWLSVKMKLLPPSGIDSWKSYVLPTLALGLTTAASIMRITRSTMLETVRMDYIRTARAKGASEKQVIFVHALKNALLPIITVLGTTFGTLLGGTVVIEVLFGMPGLGNYLINSILKKDMPAVMSTGLFLSGLFCIIMLIVDLLYAFIDPRIKAKYMRRSKS
ncbi:MAG: ABC transporter permease [Clostridia bacterium]|nr:ABC transporter permease [Clostridia bacterium]